MKQEVAKWAEKCRSGNYTRQARKKTWSVLCLKSKEQ